MAMQDVEREATWRSINVPDPEPPSLDLLNTILHKGIEDILRQADELAVLEHPYGHFVPTPEGFEDDDDDDEDDEFWNEDDEDEEDEEEETEEEKQSARDPVFQYDYGFNPILSLSRFLTQNNPKNVHARDIRRKDALQCLCTRASAALRREETRQELAQMVASMRSGVTLGPSLGELSSSSLTIWAKVAKPGLLAVEVFHDAELQSLLEIKEVAISEVDGLTAEATFDHLQPDTTYHYRVCLKSPEFGMPGPDAGYFMYGRVATLPAEQDHEEAAAEPFVFAAIGEPLRLKKNDPYELLLLEAAAHGSEEDKRSEAASKLVMDWRGTCASILECNPRFVVSVGGVVPASAVRTLPFPGPGTKKEEPARSSSPAKRHAKAQVAQAAKTSDDAIGREKSLVADGMKRLASMYQSQLGDSDLRNLMSKQSLFVSLNDETSGAATALRNEEATAEKADKDKRKRRKPWESKVDPRGPLPPVLESLRRHIPIFVRDNGTRHIYRKMACGQGADLFLLDTRNRSLGKAQTEWLVRELRASTATWKLVVSPTALGYVLPELPTKKELKEAETKTGEQAEVEESFKAMSESDIQEQKKAAVRIQALQRGKLARKQRTRSRGGKKQAQFRAPEPELKSKATAKAPPKVKFSLLDAVVHAAESGIQGMVVVTTHRVSPFAIRYTPVSSDGSASPSIFHELAVGPFGPSDASGNEAYKPPKQLNPVELFSTKSIPRGSSTFSLFTIPSHGALSFTVQTDQGNVCQEVTVR